MIRLGTDIVYIPRIQAIIDRFGYRFLKRVYTPIEQQDCGYTPDTLSRLNIHRLAGRWAAKEAIVKALGTGWRGVSYTEVEIRRQASGAPSVYVYHRAAAVMTTLINNSASDKLLGDWHLSLSHDRDYAIATAILT